MTDPEKLPAPSPEDENYKRLMNVVSWMPHRHGCGTSVVLIGFAISGVLGFWEPPYRVVGIVVGGGLIVCGMCLFYDIPLRRFGRVSKGVLWVWIVLSCAWFVYAATAQLLAD